MLLHLTGAVADDTLPQASEHLSLGCLQGADSESVFVRWAFPLCVSVSSLVFGMEWPLVEQGVSAQMGVFHQN